MKGTRPSFSVFISLDCAALDYWVWVATLFTCIWKDVTAVWRTPTAPAGGAGGRVEGADRRAQPAGRLAGCWRLPGLQPLAKSVTAGPVRRSPPDLWVFKLPLSLRGSWVIELQPLTHCNPPNPSPPALCWYSLQQSVKSSDSMLARWRGARWDGSPELWFPWWTAVFKTALLHYSFFFCVMWQDVMRFGLYFGHEMIVSSHFSRCILWSHWLKEFFFASLHSAIPIFSSSSSFFKEDFICLVI